MTVTYTGVGLLTIQLLLGHPRSYSPIHNPNKLTQGPVHPCTPLHDPNKRQAY